ncbi:MAG: RNA methyltransferase [Defluviitaleaceae bacterium]|nr:RNA methyltransferase [Defluviitaleaceae bacterium]
MSIINSTTNFRVLQWGKLKNKIHRDKQKLFIVEGYHLVSEAYKANCLKEVISTEKNNTFSVPSYQVTYDVMEKLSSLATPTKVLGICYQKEESHYGNNILLVDQIHHPGNLGTIIRSAVAFNVDTIVLNNSVDVYNQKVVQATQGMIFHINIIKSPIKDFILTLRKQNYQIIGTDVKDGLSLNSVKANKKRAVLVGNEGDGVGDELLDICDIKVNIKMNEKCESLNVGVATSIILFNLSL